MITCFVFWGRYFYGALTRKLISFKPEGNVMRLPEMMGYACLIQVIREKLWIISRKISVTTGSSSNKVFIKWTFTIGFYNRMRFEYLWKILAVCLAERKKRYKILQPAGSLKIPLCWHKSVRHAGVVEHECGHDGVHGNEICGLAG